MSYSKQDRDNLRDLQDAGFAFGTVADMKEWMAEWDRAKEDQAWDGTNEAVTIIEHDTLPFAGEQGDW